jgi:hypothetical protein
MGLMSLGISAFAGFIQMLNQIIERENLSSFQAELVV